MENEVDSVGVKKNRRKKGEGRVQTDRQKRRSGDKRYVNCRNTIVQAKAEPAEVSCKCKFYCRDISHQQKIILFQEFYKLEDNSKQNSYLLGLLIVTGVKRRRHGKSDEPGTSRRQATIYITLPNAKGDVNQVCKNTFLEVYGITEKKAKKNGGFTYTEKQGNKKTHRKFSKDDESLVPKEKSHYNRSKSDKDYLSQDLNINRLFRAFQHKHSNSHITYRYYYETCKKFIPNVSFHLPRSDTCSTCDGLNNQTKTNPKNPEVQTTLELHQRKAERATTIMKKDHERSQQPLSDNSTTSIDL